MARSAQGASPVISFVNVKWFRLLTPAAHVRGIRKPLGMHTAEIPPGRVGRPHLLSTTSACFKYSSFTVSSATAHRRPRQRWQAPTRDDPSTRTLVQPCRVDMFAPLG